MMPLVLLLLFAGSFLMLSEPAGGQTLDCLPLTVEPNMVSSVTELRRTQTMASAIGTVQSASSQAGSLEWTEELKFDRRFDPLGAVGQLLLNRDGFQEGLLKLEAIAPFLLAGTVKWTSQPWQEGGEARFEASLPLGEKTTLGGVGCFTTKGLTGLQLDLSFDPRGAAGPQIQEVGVNATVAPTKTGQMQQAITLGAVLENFKLDSTTIFSASAFDKLILSLSNVRFGLLELQRSETTFTAEAKGFSGQTITVSASFQDTSITSALQLSAKTGFEQGELTFESKFMEHWAWGASVTATGQKGISAGWLRLETQASSYSLKSVFNFNEKGFSAALIAASFKLGETELTLDSDWNVQGLSKIMPHLDGRFGNLEISAGATWNRVPPEDGQLQFSDAALTWSWHFD